MINDFIWKNYLNSGGNSIVEMFSENLKEEYTPKFADGIRELHNFYCPCKEITSHAHKQLLDLCEAFDSLEDGEYSIDSALEFLWNSIDETNDKKIPPSGIFSVFTYNMEYFTTCLFMDLPDLFFPYYFPMNFNILQKIAEEFEIILPEMPAKKDYQKRFYYYGELCQAMMEFRDDNNLSPYEFCAFLYDFAPKYIGGTDSYIIKDLPQPKSAYFIGGSKNDTSLNYKDGILAWQCNPETKAGDMIVMYMRTPISAVDSFWRSVSVGFNDPFFYYYRMTYIGNYVSADRVTQKQMQADTILGKMPIVKKNMQGINGVELKPSEYNHLVDLSNAKTLKLEYVLENNDTGFVCEKDVENKLIKRLIERLGYCERDYTQQLQIKIGNHNNKLIPDFVLLPVVEKGHHFAYAIIEAKLKISSQKELEEVKTQARSYAKQLGVKFSVVASKDKIWVSTPKDDYSKDIYISTWQELNDADNFAKLYKTLGKKQ